MVETLGRDCIIVVLNIWQVSRVARQVPRSSLSKLFSYCLTAILSNTKRKRVLLILSSDYTVFCMMCRADIAVTTIWQPAASTKGVFSIRVSRSTRGLEQDFDTYEA